MSTQPLRVCVILEALGDRAHLGRALFFPELAQFDTRPERLESQLLARVGRRYARLNRAERWRRQWPQLPESAVARVTLEPPAGQVAWLEPLEVSLPFVHWPHGDLAHIAYVPSLGIEVIAATRDEALALAPVHIRQAIMRRKAAKLGLDLARLGRSTGVRVVESVLEVQWPTLGQAVRRDRAGRERSVLDQIATALHPSALPPAYEMERTVEQLAQTLTGPPAQSVILVGPSGVGKTAAALEMVRRRADFGLAQTEFHQTSGARLVAGMSGFGMWQERCLRMCRELAKRRAILLVGNLIELMEVGRSTHNAQGIAEFLKPYIQRGDVLAVAECTAEQWAVVERRQPRLLEGFSRIDVPEPTQEVSRRILSRAAAAGAGSRRISLAPGVLDRLEQVHRRYATYSAHPGRPLRFLGNLLADQGDGTAIDQSTVSAAFSRETGLPPVLLDDAVPMYLAATAQWFRERVIGQSEAVERVVEALARVKARLARPGRPIASLLFIGPTGVGKTEMAKALARFLFGSTERLVRVDMSEYGGPDAAARLAGGGVGEEGFLTAKVREQPFRVVLLDEFEKADAAVFDLLLQVLGEGRLTDAAGRVADFCNTVIIMTSNLGARSYQRGPFGFAAGGDGRLAAAQHFTEEVRAHLRPELFNRLDAVIPFAPLDELTAVQITRREIELARQRDGLLLRDLQLGIDEAVVQHLARRGFDPLYGARPLKRAIEQHLLAPLAQAANRYAAALPLRAGCAMRDGAIAVEVAPREDPREPGADFTAATVAGLVQQCLRLRRTVQHIEKQPAYLAAQNGLFQLERQMRLGQRDLSRVRDGEARHAGRNAGPAVRELAEVSARADAIRSLLDRLTDLRRKLCETEDAALRQICLREPLADNPQLLAIPEVHQALRRWAIDFYLHHHETPAEMSMAVFGAERGAMLLLGLAYLRAVPAPAITAAVQFVPDPNRPKGGPPLARRIDRLDRFLADDGSEFTGFALRIAGAEQVARLGPEAGVHVFIDKQKNEHECLVLTMSARLDTITPPQVVGRRGALAEQPRVRKYDTTTRRLTALAPGQEAPGNPVSFVPAVAELIESRFQRSVWDLLGLEAVP